MFTKPKEMLLYFSIRCWNSHSEETKTWKSLVQTNRKSLSRIEQLYCHCTNCTTKLKVLHLETVQNFKQIKNTQYNIKPINTDKQINEALED